MQRGSPQVPWREMIRVESDKFVERFLDIRDAGDRPEIRNMPPH
jgi:hypothetical protein